jgi:hypothetical protein
MFFSSQELSTSTSETPNIVQGPETKRYGYKTLTCILYPNCASTCTLMKKKKKKNIYIQTAIHITFPVQKKCHQV